MSRSHVGGGGTRVTTHHSNGGSTDKTYVDGKCVDITDNKSDGTSHSHEVKHGWFGTSKGDRKD